MVALGTRLSRPSPTPLTLKLKHHVLRTNPSVTMPVKPYRLATIIHNAASGVQPVTEAEEEANKKRWEESGNKEGSVDQWRWTLNWDRIADYPILVGSCPRSPEDVDRICKEAGATAILSLQSDVCLDAMAVSFPPLNSRATENGTMYVRCPMIDFSHDNQSAMLPEAVRMLATLLAMGKTVYVHCTAGINRASLTVVGYLTFVQGLDLDYSVHTVKSSRSQAHPYIDCWWTVRTRLLENRSEEVVRLARSLFQGRRDRGEAEDAHTDWVAAENLLVKQTFNQYVNNNMSLVGAIQATAGPSSAVQDGKLMCYTEDEAEALALHVAELQEKAEKDRAALLRAAEELTLVREQLDELRSCALQEDSEECTFSVLEEANAEIASLRAAIVSITERTSELLKESTI